MIPFPSPHTHKTQICRETPPAQSGLLAVVYIYHSNESIIVPKMKKKICKNLSKNLTENLCENLVNSKT